MHIHPSMISAIVVLLLGTDASAESMARQQYLILKNAIHTEHALSAQACNRLILNAYEVCMAEATGAKRIALAELLTSYKPSASTRYQALSARANAEYAVVLAKCKSESVMNKSSCWSSAEENKINTINAASMSWGKPNN